MTDESGSTEILLLMPNIPPQLLAEIQVLIPVLVEWAERMEAKALTAGTPLNDQLKNTAKRLGIRQPDAVRVLVVQNIPEPENHRIVELSERFGLSFSGSAGMTLGHAIFVLGSSANDQRVLTHELVHVRQYEDMENISPYLNGYVQQIVVSGYQNMPFEVEAANETNRILGPPRA
jgi:Domain of unknown function (DUF4157)